ncbi:uncharacterized protein Fot_08130 [Forsythia ovata]|uniref:SAWADEE domain-containing protein n=1 Tax=Forsythia ovata TaxID=205694 RepID=A0ABD1WY40_9LAMI
MANGGCNDSAPNDDVELEAKCKDDFSWHPCQVSLCSTGLGLIVHYGDSDSEETIVDKKEVLARLRVRSVPLQGNSCSLVQLGDHVLATQNSHVKGLFFDAQVEEVIRVRHSKKIHCRCTFTIKWLHRAHEGGALTIPSSAIMKLATESINLHPTISAFFCTPESSSGLSASPFPTIADSMDWEMDIHALLEKQIEEISNSADVSVKKKSDDILFGIQVDSKGQIHGRSFDTSKLTDSHVQGVLNHLKRTTRSRSKQPMETKIRNPSSAIPSVRDEPQEIRSPTNPLAARAALASLRSKFPQNAELSVQDNVEKADIITVDSSSVMDEISIKIEATLTRENPKYEGIVKTLFPTTSAPEVSEFSIISSRARLKGKENEDKDPVKKTAQPSEKRLTSSAVQRNTAIHENVEMTYSKQTKLRSSSKTRSVTHSTVNKAEKIPAVEANSGIEEKISTKCSKSKSSANKIAAQGNDLSQYQEPDGSPIDAESSRSPAEDGESLMEKDGQIIKNVSKRKFVAEDTAKLNYPKRMTRSAAREDTEKNNVQPNERLRKSRSAERDEGVKLKTTPKSEENVASHSEGIKRKFYSSKNELGSSPQLRFLPRTRSQNKA